MKDTFQSLGAEMDAHPKKPSHVDSCEKWLLVLVELDGPARLIWSDDGFDGPFFSTFRSRMRKLVILERERREVAKRRAEKESRR